MEVRVLSKFKGDTQVLLHQQKSIIHTSKQCIVHSDKTPRSMWRMSVVTELIKGKMDNNIRGALARLSNNSLLKRRVSILYPFEYVRSNRQEPADTENLRRSRREVEEIGELLRRFAE